MAWITQKTGAGALLPESGRAYLKNRLSEVAGLGMSALAIAYALALFSFSPSDPSLNSAGAGGAQNWLGA
ncbi:MAG: DNA translocase FtsK 4TM domain-containing protein, partial [Rhodospirillaceae bacterium]|nr:DNA translocase FtsK 4TM domain-containing protein [Rhodospirillaceae bacterium]